MCFLKTWNELFTSDLCFLDAFVMRPHSAVLSISGLFVTQQSGRRFILQEKKKMQLEAELMTALTSIQPRSPLVIDKHRKQTRTTSSPGNQSPNKTNPPSSLWCQTSWALQVLDSVATVTGVHHGDLRSWGRRHHLGLVQSPRRGTSDCASFSELAFS